MEVSFKEYFYHKWLEERMRAEELENFVGLVATGKRSDGTYNYCREALKKKQRNY